MNRGFRLSLAARGDLDAIWDFIARDKPGAATKFLRKIHRHFLLLSRQPLAGEARDEVWQGLRSFAVGNYVIYYRPVESADSRVEIVRVLHGGRDVARIFRTK